MLNLSEYLTPASIWRGICSYIREHPWAESGEHPEPAQKNRSTAPDDDAILDWLKQNAKKSLPAKEYDTFRKAITSVRNGKACSLKRENLYRLCFVLGLRTDTSAQDLFLNYLHLNELSPRSLNEFIIIAALRLSLSWEETEDIRRQFQALIDGQKVAPSDLEDGQTAEFYYHTIVLKIHSKDDLIAFLNFPENTEFFAKTRNTQYLAMFDDLELETIYNASGNELIRLVTNYGSSEAETIQDYYYSLFGLQYGDDGDSLSEKEIICLSDVFHDVFMSYDNFTLLVQRKRPVDISAGIFLLGLLKKLLTDSSEEEHDFYANFLDPGEFEGIVNDILIYFGFPVLNPDCDRFDQLLLDVYHETLRDRPELSNADFQEQYINNLRGYLHLLAQLKRWDKAS